MPVFLLLHLFGLVVRLLRLSDAPPAGDPPAADPPAADDDQDVGKLKEALRKERENTRSFKQLQREAEELRKFKQEQEQAKLTETERLQSRVKELEGKEQELTRKERSLAVRDGLATAAQAEKLGLVASSATVIRLLDLDAVEFDDSGSPKNLGALLKQLAKDEPALFSQQRRSGSADGGASGGSAPQTMNDLIRRGAGRG